MGQYVYSGRTAWAAWRTRVLVGLESRTLAAIVAVLSPLAPHFVAPPSISRSMSHVHSGIRAKAAKRATTRMEGGHDCGA